LSLAAESRPTRVRFLVVALCMAMAVLLYLDRFALTPITSTILTELAFDEKQFGRVVGAFFLVYAVCQVPAGWLSDRLGARWMLALFVALWSLATIGLALAGSLIAFEGMRMLLGAAQAGAYPAAASLLKRWIPLSGRGRANTIVSMGGRGGHLIALFLTPALAALAMHWLGWQAGGWRLALGLYGLLGLAWAALFAALYRDSPQVHPWCNDAERRLLGDERQIARPTMHDYSRFVVALLTSREMLLMCVINIAINIGWIFLVTWMPRYISVQYGAELSRYTRQPEVVIGLLAVLPAMASIVGGLCGGAATDLLARRYGRTWGRRLPGLTAGVVVSGLYLVATQCSTLLSFLTVIIVIAFVIDFGLGASWASFQDIGGRQVAVVLGLGNMCGNLGAAFFGSYIGTLASGGHWTAVFVIAAAAMAIYAACWALFDAARPILPEATENAS
jgi:sugar phosphate permease